MAGTVSQRVGTAAGGRPGTREFEMVRDIDNSRGPRGISLIRGLVFKLNE
jgi:hypothetical protein